MIPSLLPLRPDDPAYPADKLALLGAEFVPLALIGQPKLLRRPLVALLCSLKCPGELILKTYDLARRLRDEGVAVVSGFQSPMEREALHILLKGTQPIVIAPARSLEGMRLPAAYRGPLEQGRLLLVSPFTAQERRATAELAAARNRLVGALAGRIVIIHAAPGGKLGRACGEFVSWGKPVYALQSEANWHLAALGVRLEADPLA